MTVMLRLNPAHPPLWRDADLVQLGEPAIVRIAAPDAWHAMLLHELGRGIPDAGIDVWAEHRRVRPSEARAFVAALAPAIVRTRLEEHTAPPRTVTVHATADTPLVRSIALALEVAGWRLRVTATDPCGAAVRDTAVTTVADLAIVIADRAVDPRRVRGLLAHDRPHLPVVATGSGVVVGPLVRPGSTPCTTCLDLHRRDADPAWPALVAQLIDATPPPLTAQDTLLAAVAVERMLAGDVQPGSAVTVHGGESAMRVWTTHPECGCLAPTSSASAGRSERDSAWMDRPPRRATALSAIA